MKFIVFEGLDGSGKDTQLDNALSYIRQKNKYSQLWITREPTHNTEAGREIAKKLKEGGFKSGYEALDLYVKDRIEQTAIRKEILKHSHILSSRFDYSTYAYQVAQGLSFEEVYKAHDYSKILIPDITFIFDVSIENIEKRLSGRGDKKEFFEELSFLKIVREKYLEAYEKLKNERNIYLIDANNSIKETFEEVKKILDKELEIS
ncbi:dTMP kinase [Candidatus Gracilibacteria bacterium]|nr:dTMP kinase [Candidatus Gracilibacteria bacterium]